jgi:hypothetical protein
MLRFASSFLLLAIGCGSSASPPIEVPEAAPSTTGGETAIAGRYLFESVDSCVRAEGDDPQRRILLPVDRIAPGTTVSVELDSDRLLFHYQDSENGPSTASIALDGATWEGSRLVLRPKTVAAAYPGVAGGSRSCSLYRARDGSLVLRDRQVQTGLALFFIPFRDREETVVVLEPARQ